MKTTEYRPQSGPDAARLYVITRMSAFAADRWARKIIKALARAGASLPPNAFELGTGGLAGLGMGLFGHMEDEAVEDAFSTLLGCVTVKRDPKNPALQPQPLLEMDIEDPMTLTNLRTEAFKLHVGFIKAAASQISPLVAAVTEESPQNPPAA